MKDHFPPNSVGHVSDNSATAHASHDALTVPAMLRIYVQVEGEKKPKLVEMPSTASIKDVLTPLAAQGVHVGDDIVMFVEDEEDELPQHASLDEHGIKHRDRLHCHRCRKIEVHVSLNGTNHCRTFAPSARIAKVKKWAAPLFEKDGFEGTDEMALQIAKSTDQPADDVHIGTLVTHPTCELTFDFIGKPLVQGDEARDGR